MFDIIANAMFRAHVAACSIYRQDGNKTGVATPKIHKMSWKDLPICSRHSCKENLSNSSYSDVLSESENLAKVRDKELLAQLLKLVTKYKLIGMLHFVKANSRHSVVLVFYINKIV